jgi:hypothetical protein
MVVPIVLGALELAQVDCAFYVVFAPNASSMANVGISLPSTFTLYSLDCAASMVASMAWNLSQIPGHR